MSIPTKSPESLLELASQEVSMAASNQKIANFFNDIDTFLKPLQEAMEHKHDKKKILLRWDQLKPNQNTLNRGQVFHPVHEAGYPLDRSLNKE